MKLVTVPGIQGSDEAHWQSRWEAALGSEIVRIAPSSWSAPDLTDWSRAISAAVADSHAEVVLVAHSIGCLAATHWVNEFTAGVAGVLLVAPPDPTGSEFPDQEAPTFVNVDIRPVGLPGLVVTSDDDPYCDRAGAVRLCEGWDLPCVSVGKRGHLNSSSGLGSWELGWDLLTAFMAGLGGHITHAGPRG